MLQTDKSKFFAITIILILGLFSMAIFAQEKDETKSKLDNLKGKIEKLTIEDKKVKNESSNEVRKRVQRARDAQTKRFKHKKITSNAEMSNKDIKEFCKLSDECISLLRLAVAKMNLSARSYHRTIKLSRTIADLEESKSITSTHIAEALQYRPRLETI